MLTGIDDHSRLVVVASVLEKPSGTAVCEAFIAAMNRWGVPFEVLTDNGKQFTGKFTRPLPAEVLFERTCRECGIAARLTKRRSPTTTGNIERFHRTLRRDLLDETGAFETIEAAQIAIDEWVHAYNTVRPHQSLDMATPAALFRARPAGGESNAAELDEPDPSGHLQPPETDRRRSLTLLHRATTAVVFDTLFPPSDVANSAGAQQIWVGRNYGGRTVVMWVDLTSVHVILDDAAVKTVLSKLTTIDLERLTRRGTRPGRTSPASVAVDPSASSTRPPRDRDRSHRQPRRNSHRPRTRTGHRRPCSGLPDHPAHRR